MNNFTCVNCCKSNFSNLSNDYKPGYFYCESCEYYYYQDQLPSGSKTDINSIIKQDVDELNKQKQKYFVPRISNKGRRWVITKKWKLYPAIVLLFITIPLILMLISLIKLVSLEHVAELMPLVYILGAFVFAGVYFSALFFFNKTKLEVTNNEIHITHGPLPSLKKTMLKNSDLQLLYLSRARISRKNRTSPKHLFLFALTKDGKLKKLLSLEEEKYAGETPFIILKLITLVMDFNKNNYTGKKPELWFNVFGAIIIAIITVVFFIGGFMSIYKGVTESDYNMVWGGIFFTAIATLPALVLKYFINHIKVQIKKRKDYNS